MTHNVEPRIYVACLASYNNGVLHGEWIDASDNVDEMQDEVNRILRASPYPNVTVMHEGEEVPSAEEWAIHDHEGLGDLGEYSGLQEVARRGWVAARAAEVAEDRGMPVAVLLEALSDMASADTDPEDFLNDRYCGQYDSWKDYAEEFHEEVGDLESVPDWLKHHIDWESVGQEMSHEMSSVEHNGYLYVFYQ